MYVVSVGLRRLLVLLFSLVPIVACGDEIPLSAGSADCTEEGLDAPEATQFTVAHHVIDGELASVCFGSTDDRLIEAWDHLATITPKDQLRDLALFGGFESTEEGDETTLAFVNPLDDDGTIFQMSVNLPSAEEDENELQLTMAHEFSHVFAGLATQIDRFVAEDDCDTYWNGEGCYVSDSLMFSWIQEFWTGGLIDEVDPEQEASGESGEERCNLYPGFFGAYGASNPEEDFAEAFSAYVYQLEVDSDEQYAKMVWFDSQPGLAAFRERAVDAGVGPLRNNFDPCG